MTENTQSNDTKVKMAENNVTQLVSAEDMIKRLQEQLAQTHPKQEEPKVSEFKDTVKVAGLVFGQLLGATVREIKSHLPSPEQIGKTIGNTVVISQKIASTGASITKSAVIGGANASKGFFAELKKGYNEANKK